MQILKGILLNNEGEKIAKISLVRQRENEAEFDYDPDSFNSGAAAAGTPVVIQLFNPLKGLEIYTGEVLWLGAASLRVGNFRAEQQINRRNDVKASVDYQVYVIHTSPKEPKGLKAEKFPVSLKDISAGGIRFVTDRDLPEQLGRYEVAFERSKQPVVLEFTILRKSQGDDGSFLYGCQFVNLSADQEQLVREYVFKRQLEQIGHYNP